MYKIYTFQWKKIFPLKILLKSKPLSLIFYVYSLQYFVKDKIGKLSYILQKYKKNNYPQKNYSQQKLSCQKWLILKCQIVNLKESYWLF